MERNLDQWEQALVDDDWTPKGVYTWGQKYLPLAHSAQFERDGFIVQIYRRFDCDVDDISAWGPDKASIPLPQTYDFAAMQAALKICGVCGRDVEKTTPSVLRVAKRVCPDCLPTRAQLLEPNKHW